MVRSGIIQDLKSKDNLMLLVVKDIYKTNWQTPETILDFVRNNYERVDEVDVFDVYVDK